MNRVILMGRLTRDAEVRYSQGDSQSALARFTNRDGQKVYTTDVVVDNVEFAESKGSAGSDGGFVPADRPSPSQASDGFMNIPGGIDEELPFN